MPNVLCAATLLMVCATPVLGQIPAELERSAAVPLESVAENAPDTADAASAVSSPSRYLREVAVPKASGRDSLWNGAIVGAGIGAMAGLAFGVLREDGCRACAGFNQPLVYGSLFAAVGAGVGAGIDAMFARAAPVKSGSSRVRVLPLLSKEVRGVAGWVRF
ncbi:MAG TPA: hypothetical protein VFV95_21210 [Vicinamibacterales bacterium]|nr:hypothetical protein [Vicinamibacterales bacterium]